MSTADADVATVDVASTDDTGDVHFQVLVELIDKTYRGSATQTITATTTYN